MSYYLKRFGPAYATATALPIMGADQDLGPDPVLPTNIVLPGGGTFNARGTDQALPSGHTVTARGIYEAATVADLQVLTDAMRAWIGKWSILWLYCADESVRWRYARLLAAPMRSGPHEYALAWQPMELTFELDDMLWYGDIHEDIITLNESPKIAVAVNNGNQVVRDVKIEVTAKESAITQLDLANAKTGHVSFMRFSGTIAQDKSLIVLCGDMSVKNDLVDAWNDWNRQGAHRINEWLRVGPGDNILTVTRTGGGNTSTCKLEFYDGYS